MHGRHFSGNNSQGYIAQCVRDTWGVDGGVIDSPLKVLAAALARAPITPICRNVEWMGRAYRKCMNQVLRNSAARLVEDCYCSVLLARDLGEAIWN